MPGYVASAEEWPCNLYCICYSVVCTACGRRFEMSAKIEAREIMPDAEHDLWNRAKLPDEQDGE